MRVIVRYFVLLSAALLLSEAFSSAQIPSTLESTAKLLNSQDISERAWGAYVAGENGFSELQPNLEGILEDGIALTNQSLVRSVLDAAIKMRTDLPSKILSSIYRKYPDETTILLAQSPQNHPDLILSLFQSERLCARWLALGNLLWESKAPGFPLVLMQDLKQMQIVVLIHDPNDPGGGMGGGWGEGIGDFSVPIGYPPVTIYSLSDHATADASVVAKGPHTIYAIKKIINPGASARIHNGGGFIADYWESNAYRLEYLSSLLYLPNDDIRFNKYFTIDWNGPVQFAKDVTLLCSRVIEKYDRILALLRDAGLISRSQAETLESSIVLEFTDFRRDKTIELPVIILNRVTISKQ